MIRNTSFLMAIGVAVMGILLSCKKPKPKEIIEHEPVFVDSINRDESFLLTIKNMGGGVPLVLESSLDSGKTYFTNFHEPFKVKSFMYYVSNIVLIDEHEIKIPLYPTYNLVDASQGDFQQMFSIPNHQFKAIEFLIGVDSIRNVSGIQSGALDPLLGMFWEWNTGYIMAKLDGVSDSAAYGIVTLHAGGFKGDYNVLRTVRMNFDHLWQANGVEHNVVIYTEMLKWFDGGMQIQLKNKSVISTMGPDASSLADNYKNMFIKTEIR